MNARKISEVVLSIVAGIFIAVLGTTVSQAQVSQSAVAQLLVGGDRSEQVQAIRQAYELEPDDMDSELRNALITALDRQNEAYYSALDAFSRGEPGVSHEEDEFAVYADITRLVIALEDPVTIPSLAGALGTGANVREALVAFGELAAPAVLAIVLDAEGNSLRVAAGLFTLRVMIQTAGVEAFSSSTTSQMRSAAMQRLTTGEQSAPTMWHAIDLAAVLDDPGLRQIVTSIASNADEVIARGIQDMQLIARIQQTASDRLAGIAPSL